MIPQAPSRRFRTESRLEAAARAWPSSGALGRLRGLLKPAYEALLALRAGGVLESRLPGGEIVRFRTAWRHLSWNAEEYAALRGVVRPGDVVIDAGANAGAYTMLFAQWVGPAGRVYAFEPEPRAYAALTDHVRLNGLADRVVAVRAAVGEKTGSARLHVSPASGLSRVSDAADADAVVVPAVSVDAFCAQHGLVPSVVKVDVEGAELEVLRGAREVIARGGPDLHLFVEMHPTLWRAADCSPAAILRECEISGVAPERLDGSRDALWSVEGVCLRLRPATRAR